MLIIIEDLTLRPNEPEDRIPEILRTRYGIPADSFRGIVRKSLDCRNKNNIVYRYRISAEVSDESEPRLLAFKEISQAPAPAPAAYTRLSKDLHVLIAGAGPAGLFCALRLIEAGARVDIFERGKPLEDRMKDIALLETEGRLDPESNVLFGEGGAGTYSDGKLTSRTQRIETEWFFSRLIELGAPSSIAYESKPHIGTDRLRALIRRVRDKITASGSGIHFNEKITDLLIADGKLAGAVTASGREWRCARLVLATGHSARDTYELLASKSISMEKKGFAVGLRIEHPAQLINDLQYGSSPFKSQLPPAEYLLTWNNKNTGRGVYSFCMCPGGRIINSSSENGRLCTNGMSFSRRNEPWSNAAVVVTISPEDLPGTALAGMEFQRRLEERACSLGRPGAIAPAQTLGSFLSGGIDDRLPECSYLPGVIPADLSDCLPGWVSEEIRIALRYFDKKMRGYLYPSAVLIGAETRTSSPVRILRDDNLMSVSVKGLFPAGEGSGYSGGIVSSAVDGIRAADKILAGCGG